MEEDFVTQERANEIKMVIARFPRPREPNGLLLAVGKFGLGMTDSELASHHKVNTILVELLLTSFFYWASRIGISREELIEYLCTRCDEER